MTLRDILNPWRALREARTERDSARSCSDISYRAAVYFQRLFGEQLGITNALSVELAQLKRAPKRDAKGRFVG